MSLKISLTVAAALTCFAAWTQPVPPPSPADRQRTRSFWGSPGSVLEFITPKIGPYTSKVVLVTGSLIEISVAYATQHDAGKLAQQILSLAFTDPAQAARISTSRQFIAGAVLAITGSLVRLASFRAMGQQFTFQFTMREKHTLVTHGPYTIVRHPSYTGLVMAFVGLSLCALSDGVWFTEAGILQTHSGKAVAAVWVACHTAAVVVCGRAWKEEDMLRSVFGTEWDAYARRVKWMFIPGIL